VADARRFVRESLISSLAAAAASASSSNGPSTEPTHGSPTGLNTWLHATSSGAVPSTANGAATRADLPDVPDVPALSPDRAAHTSPGEDSPQFSAASTDHGPSVDAALDVSVVADAELAVSEIVTNALVHAGTPVDVTTLVDELTVRVEVGDGSPHLPDARDYDDLAGTGRGLRLLDELVDVWGVTPRVDGKVVWFELFHQLDVKPSPGDYPPLSDPLRSDPLGSTDPATDVVSRGDGAAIPGVVVIELVDVPLVLHVAWHSYAETMLRELLLSQLDEDDPGAVLERHAAANDALALLQEQVPAPELGEDPADVLAMAIAAENSTNRVRVRVPTRSVPNFALLRDMLTDAFDLADAGALLSQPSQPELRTYTDWICDHLVRRTSDAFGRSSLSWTTPISDSTARPAREPWAGDTANIATPDDTGTPANAGAAAGELASVTIDDAGRIVSVSSALLHLLGYRDDSGALVGERLLVLIPQRYRQAHLAGLTLHLTTGRQPLLGQPVTVPMLNSRGGEIMVDMTVERRTSPNGVIVFVATLAPA
jgi:PAS domain S-box-containing protein